MQDIHTTITNNFHKNIDYIQIHHPVLFSKLSSYDSAVENGHYKEKYELVYKNNNFDVFESATGLHLYQKQSQEYATLAAKSLEYGVCENLFEGSETVTISDEQVEMFNALEPLKHYMSGFAPIINFTQKMAPQNIKLKKLHKYIFFGTGLGTHLITIDKQIQAKVYLIIEDDLELFRLSLFTTDYAKLAENSRLIFSIFEDQEEFVTTANLFLKEQYYYNHYIKYFQMLSHSSAKREEFHIAVGSQSHQLFFYHHLLEQYLTPLEYMLDNYKFLNKSLNFSTLSSKEKPFILLAAGPSLQKNIQWLEKNQHNFIVVALSATLSLLEKHHIIPDIITHVDGFKGASIHFTKLKKIKNLQNSLCFFSDRTSQEVLSFFSKDKIYFFENGTTYKQDSLKPSAPCAGSLSFQLLITLKVRALYLLGLDLTVDPHTGATHSSEHSYNRQLNTDKRVSNERAIAYKESLFEVEGNMTPSLLTTSHFKSSIDTINLSTKLLKQDFQTIYNLSDGAKFLDALAKNIHKTKIKEWNKAETTKEIISLVEELPLEKFTPQEQQSLGSKYQMAQNFQDIITAYAKKEFMDAEEYLQSLERLVQELTNTQLLKENEISRVIDAYLQYILSYIFDFFNHKESKNDTGSIKQLHHLLLTHLDQIIKHYMQKIETKLNKG